MVNIIQLKMDYKYIGFDGHYGGDEYERVLCHKISNDFPSINLKKIIVKRKGGIKSIPSLIKLLILGYTCKGKIIRQFGIPIFRKDMTVILHHYDQNGSPYYTKILEYTDRFCLNIFSNILNIKFITVSKYWSNWVKNNFRKKSYVIYNEVVLNLDNIKDKKYLSNKYKLNIRSKWIFIGGNQPKKGGALLVKYLQKMYPNNLNNIQIIQTGFSLNRENQFSVIRWIESIDYLSFISSCDVVIANSQFSEGWCRILHEAALLDIPIAGSGIGGMGELLELINGKSSYTIDELCQIIVGEYSALRADKTKLNQLKEISNFNLNLWLNGK